MRTQTLQLLFRCCPLVRAQSGRGCAQHRIDKVQGCAEGVKDGKPPRPDSQTKPRNKCKVRAHHCCVDAVLYACSTMLQSLANNGRPAPSEAVTLQPCAL